MDWRLFTYNIRHDTGYAPNPFFDVCTLNTCKPQIRREANEGDWVVALKSDRVICVMKVTRKMTMAEYWDYCIRRVPGKIPPQSAQCTDPRWIVGDCQYEFSSGKPRLLQGSHESKHVQRDLSGQNTLLSTHFVYFGLHERRLPRELVPIAQCATGKWIGRGRKSRANDPYRADFLQWVERLPCRQRKLFGLPTDNPFDSIRQ
jgi:hypothetical protein